MTKSVRDVAAAVILDEAGADGGAVRVLLLQRGATAPTYPGHWGVVTGYVEAGETPAQTAEREIVEELGVTGRVVQAGEPFQVDVGPFFVQVWPLRCVIEDPLALQLQAENQRYAWVALADVFERPTVPNLDQDFRALGLL